MRADPKLNLNLARQLCHVVANPFSSSQFLSSTLPPLRKPPLSSGSSCRIFVFPCRSMALDGQSRVLDSYSSIDSPANAAFFSDVCLANRASFTSRHAFKDGNDLRHFLATILLLSSKVSRRRFISMVLVWRAFTDSRTCHSALSCEDTDGPTSANP